MLERGGNAESRLQIGPRSSQNREAGMPITIRRSKTTACVLLEVGLHNPLAAAIGHTGQSEWQLSVHLLDPALRALLDRPQHRNPAESGW
jgi:hypothetical protein